MSYTPFLNDLEAGIARSALEAAGIESMIQSDDCGGMRPHLWMSGIDLLVRSEDVQNAEDVLGTLSLPEDGENTETDQNVDQ